MTMDEASTNMESLIENVVQFSAGGSLAAIGYRMLTTFGAAAAVATTAPSNSLPLPLPEDELPDKMSSPTTKPKSHILKDWFWPNNSKQYSSPNSGFDKEFSLPLYTLQDVSNHDTPHDCWIVLYDRVYDITGFLSMHPGGDEVMLEYAGHDATLAFRSVGHSKEAELSLKPYLIGILVESERIWTRFFNMKSDVP